jgi:hypothetical protein
VSARATGIACAALTIVLVLAQDVYPGAAFYHSWQYALLLAVALTAVLSAAWGAARGRDGASGRRLLPALAGAVVAGVAGLASGLLGPDTASVIGTPGTVTPIPALGSAAFFAAADASAIAAGDNPITLRRRDGSAVTVGAFGHRLFGESILGLEPRPAAFIDAWDERGRHLTITQPVNASFLSPVLLFREQQRIGDFTVPFDTFATPSSRRVFRALYFTPKQLAGFHHAVPDAAHPALILSIADDRGAPLGITLLPSGKEVLVAGVRVRATLGTYPALSIAAAPPTWALTAGIVLFALGLAWSALGTGRRPLPLGQPQGT